MQFPPHKERIVSIIKIAHLRLFREVMAVCCEGHTGTYKCNVWVLKILLTFSMEQLKKLTGSQLVNEFPAFYGTRRFITTFTSARHLSLSWASSIQSVPPSHFLKIHLNTLRTGDANLRFLRFCITTVKDEWRKSAFLTRACFNALQYTLHGAFLRMVLRAVCLKKRDLTPN
jgi:hypothetical protein